MTQEKLKRCNEINERLNELIAQKEILESAVSFADETVLVKFHRGTKRDLYVDYIDFNAMKALAIQKISDEIETLEKEFINL